MMTMTAITTIMMMLAMMMVTMIMMMMMRMMTMMMVMMMIAMIMTTMIMLLIMIIMMMMIMMISSNRATRICFYGCHSYLYASYYSCHCGYSYHWPSLLYRTHAHTQVQLATTPLFPCTPRSGT